ncbi:MAG TPA: hypothetical protein VHV99_13135 [Paraburkholderia sp.]|jgi:hypothetical protein|nr:hypothetical protein [Paraburkholderia sp.]
MTSETGTADGSVIYAVDDDQAIRFTLDALPRSHFRCFVTASLSKDLLSPDDRVSMELQPTVDIMRQNACG